MELHVPCSSTLHRTSAEFQPGPVKSRFVSPRNCTVDEIREVLGKYKRESAAKAGQQLGIVSVGGGAFFGAMGWTWKWMWDGFGIV